LDITDCESRWAALGKHVMKTEIGNRMKKHLKEGFMTSAQDFQERIARKSGN
jgi:hypothetical protein